MKKKKQSFIQTVGMMRWIIQLWMKLDFWGFIGYLFSEIADPIFNVARWYVLAFFVNQAQAYLSYGGDLVSYVWLPALLFFAMYMVFRLIVAVGVYFNSRRQYRFEWKLEELFVQKIQQLSLYDMDNRAFANKIALANEAKSNLIPKLNNVISIVRNIIATVVLGIPLVMQGYWFIFVGMILVTIPAMIVNVAFQEKQIKLKLSQVETRRKSIEALDVHTGISEESKEIKINNSYAILKKRGLDTKKAFNEMLLSHQWSWFVGRSFSAIAESLIIPVFLTYYVWDIVNTGGTISGIIPFFGTLYTIRITVYNFMNSFVQISEYYEEVYRIRDFLTYKITELFAKQKEHQEIQSAPAIEVKDLSFTYPGTTAEVLRKISLSIKAGEKIALVGANGAGKTTLIKLLLGMYPQNRGDILVEQVPLFSYTKEQWYSAVGVLFQDFPRYGFLTVKENLLIGNTKEEAEKELWRVLEKADAADFVKKYEDGLSQGLNHRYKGGVTPSTGQWQKMAIARMFYRNPNLVIFDEPTASIDAEAEYKIFNEIFDFFKAKTVIIVSHRFSTVRNADRIYVIEEGRISEQGTHAELLKLNGFYARSYAKQSEGYKD